MVAASRRDFVGILELPLPDEPIVVGERLLVRGWALAADPIDAIHPQCDAMSQSLLHHGILRPDVAEAYPERQHANACGFSGFVDISRQSPGAHILTVSVIANGQPLHEWQRVFYIADADAMYRAWLERPGGADASVSGATPNGDATSLALPLVSWIVHVGPDTLPGRLEQTLASLRSKARHELVEIYVLDAERGTVTIPGRSSFSITASVAPGQHPPLSGQFIGRLDAGDVLAPECMSAAAASIAADQALDLIYFDHDHVVEGRRCRPVFKPAWSPLLFETYDYLSRAWIVRASHFGLEPWRLLTDIEAPDRALPRPVIARCSRIGHIAAPLMSLASTTPAAAGIATTSAVPDGNSMEPAPAAWPKVSVIIASRLADRPMMARCLDGLRSGTVYPDLEIIVVLNNLDRSDAETAAKFLAPWSVIVLPWPESFNWSAINNYGAAQANGTYFLFLNDDIEPAESGWLKAMVALAERSGAGAVGAVLRYPDGTIQHAGVYLGMRERLECRHTFRYCTGSEPWITELLTHDRDQTAVTGACLLTPRKHFESLDGFDETLAIVYNDVDYCLRLQERGVACAVAGGAVLTHREGYSRGGLVETPDHERFIARWRDALPPTDRFSNPNLAQDRDDWTLDSASTINYEARISLTTKALEYIMSTDDEWQRWGEKDPYFGVITHEKFRKKNLTQASLEEFFRSGQSHVAHVLKTCRHYLFPEFKPTRVLDFGCGVGRLVIPFAAVADEVVGLDVSEAMLDEARRNCEQRGLENVRLIKSDDSLSTLEGTFDLIHSTIVFQHIEPRRGRAIFKQLLGRLRPGGVAVIQFTYGKAYHPQTFGQPPMPRAAPGAAVGTTSPSRQLFSFGSAGKEAPRMRGSQADPEMQMNTYSTNEILYLMQIAGIRSFHAEFSDHGGELGVVLYFRSS